MTHALEIVEVVPGKLTVTVFAHRLAKARCWTYATNGLWSQGQRELLLSVKQESEEADAAFPRELFHFFRNVYEFALQKQFVDERGVSILSDRSRAFLPGTSLRGVLYLDSAHQALGAPCLTAILVTKEEAQAAIDYGRARIFARLGQSARVFPTPLWVDRNRKSVVGNDEGSSILGKPIPRMAGHGATVCQQSSVRERAELGGCGPAPDLCMTFEKTRVILTLAPGASELLAPELSKLPKSMPFALLMSLDVHAEAAFVWHPGQTAPSAIFAGREPSTIGGNFVVFTPVEDDEGARLVEDGFVVHLRNAGFQRLKQALTNGELLDLEPSGKLNAFAVRVLPSVSRDPISGCARVSPEEWRTCQSAAPAARQGPVELAQLILLMPAEEIKPMLSATALAEVVRGIQAALLEIANASTRPAPRDFLIGCELGPSTRKKFQVFVRPREEAGPLMRAVYEKLEGIATPPIAAGTIAFQVEFALWGGAAK